MILFARVLLISRNQEAIKVYPPAKQTARPVLQEVWHDKYIPSLSESKCEHWYTYRVYLYN